MRKKESKESLTDQIKFLESLKRSYDDALAGRVSLFEFESVDPKTEKVKKNN